MKKIFSIALIAMMAICNTGCKKWAQDVADNMCKAMLVDHINDMREFPQDIKACDSIMQANYYIADNLVDIGTTTWTRENSGSISRHKYENSKSYTIQYKAEASFKLYNALYFRMWALDIHEAAGKPAVFSGYYDEKRFQTYDELYKLFDEEPQQSVTLSFKDDYKEGYFLLEVTSKGTYNLKYTHTDVILKK